MSGMSKIYLKYLIEAVQNIDVSFIEPIFDKLLDFYKNYQGLEKDKIKNSIKFMNSLLMEQHSIEIILDPESRGLTSTEGYVRLFLSPELFINLKDNPNLMLNTLKALLKHEFTHRIHSTKIGKFFNLVQYDTEDKLHYMKDKQEIMSYANQTVQEFISEGLTKEEILEYLKNSKYYDKLCAISFSFYSYLYYFWPKHDKRPIQNYRDRKVLDLYFKYLYQYLDSKYPGMEYNPKYQVKDKYND